MEIKRKVAITPSIKGSQKRSGIISSIIFFTIGWLILSMTFLALVIVGIYGWYQLTKNIMPGVLTWGIELENSTVTQAAIEIDKNLNLEKTISVTDGSHTITITPADIGIQIDSLQTAKTAYKIGHSGNPLPDIHDMIKSFLFGWHVSPTMVFDEQSALRGLGKISEELSEPPTNATLSFDGKSFVIVPSQPGYTINIDKTSKKISKDPYKVYKEGLLAVELMPLIPEIQEADILPLTEEAEKLIHSKPIIEAYDPISDEHFEWVIPADEIINWIFVKTDESGTEISLNQEKVKSYLETLNDSLGSNRWLDLENANIEFNKAGFKGTDSPIIVKHSQTLYQIKHGDTLLKLSWKVGMPIWAILEANPDLDPNNLVAGTEIIIPSKDVMLPLPIVSNKRIVIDISKQRMWIYENGKRIKEFVISTGIDKSPTQPGVFQVQTHKKNAYASVWDLYMPNFLGIYEAWPGFMNGIHGLPKLSSGVRLWASILGRPASYGCIILDTKPSQWVYKWAENGVIVEIKK